MYINKNSAGFTLIELMIVVTIIGILAAIAYPNYSEYIQRSRRADGKAALMSQGQFMERYYTENMNYNNAPLGTTATPPAFSSPEYYTLAFDSSPTSGTVCGTTSNTNGSSTAYRLCVTPTGSQSSDSCGTLSLSHTGVRTPTTGGCW